MTLNAPARVINAVGESHHARVPRGAAATPIGFQSTATIAAPALCACDTGAQRGGVGG